MEKRIWYGDKKTISFAVSAKDYEALLQNFQDNIDNISMLTASRTDLNLLSRTLQYGAIILDSYKDATVDDIEKRIIFELGRLYGVMHLSSLLCYEYKKNQKVYDAVSSSLEIKHLDDIVALLERHQVLTHSQICRHLGIKPSTLTECMKKVLATDLLDFRRIGKFKVYSLSDNGRRYAKIQSVGKGPMKPYPLPDVEEIIQMIQSSILTIPNIKNEAKPFDFGDNMCSTLSIFDENELQTKRNNLNEREEVYV